MLLIPLPIIITLQRNTSQEARRTLFILDPIVHEIRKILRTSLALSDQLHPHPAAIGPLLSGRLEDKGGVEVIHRRHPHLTIRVEREFESEDGGNGFSEFGALGREDLKR